MKQQSSISAFNAITPVTSAESHGPQDAELSLLQALEMQLHHDQARHPTCSLPQMTTSYSGFEESAFSTSSLRSHRSKHAQRMKLKAIITSVLDLLDDSPGLDGP
jgi:hypothetical protein